MANIFKTKSGKILVRIRRRGFPTVSRQFTSYTDAEVFAKQTEADMLRGRFVDFRKAEKTSLRQAIHQYIGAESIRKNGAYPEIKRLEKIARGKIGEYSLHNLTPKVARDFKDQRLLEVSPFTVTRELNILAAVMKWVVRDMNIDIAANVFSSAYCPRPRQPAGRDRRLLPNEESRLFRELDQCRNKNVVKAIRFLLLSACRRGEMLKLRWCDIDFFNAVAHLTAVQTKTGKSRRVPLPPAAIELLNSIERRDENDTAVFGLSEEAFDLAVRRAIKRAGIADLRVHDLRHESISRAAESGLFTLVELCQISGHADVRMLYRYAHILPASLAKKMAAASYGTNRGHQEN